MYRNNFLSLLRKIVLFICVSAIILGASRLIFLSLISDYAHLQPYLHDFGNALLTGTRFDLKVSVIAFMPLFLIGCICCKHELAMQRFATASKYYSGIIYFLLITCSISNYYFYKTYGNHFDVFMFGFFDDDTKAVAINIWEDYPVLPGLFFAVIASIVLAKLTGKSTVSNETTNTPSKKKTAIIAFCSVLMFFIFARGALGSFPLGRYNANVSTYTQLNKVTPNAFMAMDWARKDYFNDLELKPVSQEALENQMQKVIGQKTPLYHTEKNAYLEQNKPNVFLVFMESMGTNYLVEDNAETNDLLGALRPHLQSDFFFKRFVSGTNNTWGSIMMALTQSNHSSLSKSSYKKIQLDSLATIPYKKAGYEVSFIYAGDSGWRNSKEYLLHQGFDNFYNEEAIFAAYPEAKKTRSEWGAADEYAFKFAQHLLDTSKKPQMIFMMSITNHPPFLLPKTYDAKPVVLSQRLKDNIKNSPDEALLSQKTYQYASNSLGNFIEHVKSSSLKDNTIIAASGDHLTRSFNMELKNESAFSHGVPLYMYIPKPILEHSQYTYDNTRIGSHRDIFPTLYHYSLSDADYISLGGQNILDTKGIDNVGYNVSSTITKDGAYSNSRPQDLYAWDEDNLHTLATPTKNPKPSFAKDYDKLQDMYIRFLVNKEH